MQSDAIFKIRSAAVFDEFALELFHFQYVRNPIYQRYCNLIGYPKSRVNTVEDIPFLPIDFFKHQVVRSSTAPAERIFTSSGTSSSMVSQHHVTHLEHYRKSCFAAFEHFYTSTEEFTILALLPAYLERENSSLIYMIQEFINVNPAAESGFYLKNLEDLTKQLQLLDAQGRKILLLGVSFALLDLIEKQRFELQNTIIMETGGMKGRRKELTRNELHQRLCKGFGVHQIHSEYGMTELLSQAYSKGQGIFQCPPWMRVYMRDPHDPLSGMPPGRTGGMNIIDLGNIHSCAFIATQDLGCCYADGRFEVKGRFDNSDMRGCNLMAL